MSRSQFAGPKIAPLPEACGLKCIFGRLKTFIKRACRSVGRLVTGYEYNIERKNGKITSRSAHCIHNRIYKQCTVVQLPPWPDHVSS